jgi:hypothetical protein
MRHYCCYHYHYYYNRSVQPGLLLRKWRLATPCERCLTVLRRSTPATLAEDVLRRCAAMLYGPEAIPIDAVSISSSSSSDAISSSTEEQLDVRQLAAEHFGSRAEAQPCAQTLALCAAVARASRNDLPQGYTKLLASDAELAQFVLRVLYSWREHGLDATSLELAWQVSCQSVLFCITHVHDYSAIAFTCINMLVQYQPFQRCSSNQCKLCAAPLRTMLSAQL